MAFLGLLLGPVFTFVWVWTSSSVALALAGLGLTWLGCAAYTAVFRPYVGAERQAALDASASPDNSGATVQP